VLKKIDYLVLKAFVGPFFLTTIVVTFIFLTQTILKYIDELVGKGLGFLDYAELVGYFSINVLPIAFPLAILLASLMTFGNLGQFNELTAVKSSGVSLLRVLRPIFLWVLFFTVALYFFNDYVVPKANLKAYSLLYDLKQKKPSLELKPGVFYNGLPGYSIKIGGKFENDTSIKDVMIYDHSKNRGNTDLITADSGAMYFIQNEKYLVLELFKGYSFSEIPTNNTNSLQNRPYEFVKNQFDNTKIVFDLSSFDLQRTKEELFNGSRQMKNTSELSRTMDSLKIVLKQEDSKIATWLQPFYFYMPVSKDTTYYRYLNQQKSTALESIFIESDNRMLAMRAANQARSLKNYLQGNLEQRKNIITDINLHSVTYYQKYMQSIACIVLFLIGAPLGSIIKKGGLGIPVLISIIFFIFYYAFSLTGEKWTKEGVLPAYIAMWFGNIMLLPIGLFLLRQAKNDSRILESDIYLVWFDKIKAKWLKK
jgi:lipopolysaccharide export system permease protein